MTKIKASGEKFRPLHPSFYDDKRVQQLTPLQRNILIYGITGLQALSSKSTGIYKISTTDFVPKVSNQEAIQDQLGRTNLEIALMLNKAEKEVDEEDRKKYQGIFVRDHQSVIEYDPESDMIFVKNAFKFSGKYYLTSSKMIIEGICADHKATKDVVPPHWWNEFGGLNALIISQAWSKFPADLKTDEIKEIIEGLLTPSLTLPKTSPNLLTQEKFEKKEIDLKI